MLICHSGIVREPGSHVTIILLTSLCPCARVQHLVSLVSKLSLFSHFILHVNIIHEKTKEREPSTDLVDCDILANQSQRYLMSHERLQFVPFIVDRFYYKYHQFGR